MGGHQNGKGSTFGWDYDRGSIRDKIVEAYAGVHDWFNGEFWGGYDAFSYNKPQGSWLVQVKRGFVNYLDVPLATPFVAASVSFPITPQIIHNAVQ